MSHQDDRSTVDQLLDLLLAALQERQRAQRAETAAAPPLFEIDTAAASDQAPAAEMPAAEMPAPLPEPEAAPDIGDEAEETEETAAPDWQAVDDDLLLPEKLPPIHLDRMLRRLALMVGVLLIVINIPFNRFGAALARAMPDTQSLIIRDGLVLKGSGEKIYVLENNEKRWITTLDAFEWYGYRWEQVRQVEDDFLDQFPDGRPIYLLLKCEGSPHIYALEDGKKRWIKDIPTFESLGFVWDDIRFESCTQLRRRPDGVPFPADAGPPPQP